LHGTPPFIINGSTTVTTRQYAGCITSLTDRTGCPGLAPPLTEVTAFTVSEDTICKGEGVTLEASATGHAFYSFNEGNTWAPGGATATASFTPDATTTYTVHVMNAGGCSATASPLTVTVHPLPIATFNNAPSTACAGSSLTLTAGTGGDSYCFTESCSACAYNPYASGNDEQTDYDCVVGSATCTFEASNSYTLTMPDSGNVTICVRVVNANGCIDSSCVTIGIISVPTPVLSGGGTHCAANVSLQCFGETGYTYQLQNSLLQNTGVEQTGANAPLSFPIIATGVATYTVVATDAATSCTAVSNTQAVSWYIPPVAPTSLTANASICVGVSATLTASGGDTGSGAVYEWGTGAIVGENPLSPATTTAATRTISVTEAVPYWVRLISTSACTDTTAGAVLTPITIGADYGYTTITVNGASLDVQKQNANGGQTTCWAPNNLCPPGWRWPTIAELQFLIENQIISVADNYWSSENYNDTHAYYVGVAGSYSYDGCMIYPVSDLIPGTRACVQLPWFSCGYSYCGYSYSALAKTRLFTVRCVR
jgi:hypothetical protein